MSPSTGFVVGPALAVAGLGLLVAAGLVWVIGQSLRHATRPRGPHTHLPGVTDTTRKENQP